jgi:hypothetical protein
MENYQDRGWPTNGDTSSHDGHNGGNTLGGGRGSNLGGIGGSGGGAGGGGAGGGGLPGLGQTRDPVELIPGDVAELDELARVFAADSLIGEQLATMVHAVRDGDWSGAAAEGFHARLLSGIPNADECRSGRQWRCR